MPAYVVDGVFSGLHLGPQGQFLKGPFFIVPGHLRWEASGVRLIPKMGFFAKNQLLKSGSFEIFLPAISTLSLVEEDKVWCPVRALKWYVDRT